MDDNVGSPKRRRWTAAQRQRLLSRYHQSQFTQAEFAERQGMGHSTLARWLAEERAHNPSPVPFAEVQVSPTHPPAAIEIVSPQGWTVRLPHSADGQALAQLLRALPC